MRNGVAYLQTSTCKCSHRQAKQNTSRITYKLTKSRRGCDVDGFSEQFSALLSSSAISPPLFWHYPSQTEPCLWQVTVSDRDSSLTAHMACSHPLPAHPWRLLAHTSKHVKWLGKRNVHLLLQKEDARHACKSPQCIFWTTSSTSPNRAVFSGHLNTCKLLQPWCWGSLGAVGRAETRVWVTAATRRDLHPEAELSSVLKLRSSWGNSRSQRSYIGWLG